ncbi:MAG: hypothetical protein DRP08_04800 [Candidatus Aenigmatarchaeota archaeon]|nr:MAG: hypothetical protein DRP08_04800 [Candidatus Aenigmarchaeota archaeon]
MSRRTRRTTPTVLTPKKDYWQRFLEAQNLVGLISEEIESMPRTEEESSTELELSTEQEIFIDRVANKLYDAPYMVEHIKKGLRDVFLGKLDFNEWFDRTKVERGLKSIELMQILYDSLKGLRGREIRALRESYAQALKKLQSL